MRNFSFIGKLYSQILGEAEELDDADRIASLDNLLLSKLPQFELSENIEVQERVRTLFKIVSPHNEFPLSVVNLGLFVD